MATKQTGLRKRQQIAKANRMMFLWVAGTSVIVGFALVGGIFLGQKLVFNEKVLAEKRNTVSVLRDNNEVIPELENNVRVLDTNQGLMDSRSRSDEKPIQVILDALPADKNATALGSSIQDRIIGDINGVKLESISVDSDIAETDVSDDLVMSSTSNEVGFQLTVSGSANNLKKVLQNMEKSIRAISVTSVAVQSDDNRLMLEIIGHAYYEPAVSTDLKEKVVKP